MLTRPERKAVTRLLCAVLVAAATIFAAYTSLEVANSCRNLAGTVDAAAETCRNCAAVVKDLKKIARDCENMSGSIRDDLEELQDALDHWIFRSIAGALDHPIQILKDVEITLRDTGKTLGSARKTVLKAEVNLKDASRLIRNFSRRLKLFTFIFTFVIILGCVILMTNDFQHLLVSIEKEKI